MFAAALALRVMYAFCESVFEKHLFDLDFIEQNKQDVFLFADSAFKQQRLPAWQPILTAGTVLPTFFVIGIAFIPVGIGLLYFSEEVKEFVVDYTHCNKSILQDNGNYLQTTTTCADIISKNSSETCYCDIPFTLDVDFKVRNCGWF